MDVFGQKHLIETYSEEGIRRGFSEIDHLEGDDIRELLETADAAVIRDPSKVSGRLLSELESSNFSRTLAEEYGHRGVYVGDPDKVEEEILYHNENLLIGTSLKR